MFFYSHIFSVIVLIYRIMKIAFILTQSLDSPSGLGRYGPLAKGLARLGNQVDIFALHPNFDSLQETDFELDGVNVHYVAQMHVVKQGNEKNYFSANRLITIAAKATWKLTKGALAIPFDIIHVGKPHPMNSIAGVIAKRLLNSKLYLDLDDREVASGHFTSKWQRRVVDLFERKMPIIAQTITTNTYYTRDILVKSGIPAEKIIYLSNGIDQDRFNNLASKLLYELRYTLGLEGKRIVAFIGSLSRPSHPVDLLICAFQEIILTVPNAVLLIVGGGDDYTRLKSEVKKIGLEKQVCFVGWVPPAEVAKYYAFSDVSVDPVFDDEAARGRAPLKLFESWACGTPFVTSDVGDRKKLLGNPPAGLLAKAGDPSSLAKVIIKVLIDDQLAYDLRWRGKERVKNYYWDQLAVNLDKIYRSNLHRS